MSCISISISISLLRQPNARDEIGRSLMTLVLLSTKRVRLSMYKIVCIVGSFVTRFHNLTAHLIFCHLLLSLRAAATSNTWFSRGGLQSKIKWRAPLRGTYLYYRRSASHPRSQWYPDSGSHFDSHHSHHHYSSARRHHGRKRTK